MRHDTAASALRGLARAENTTRQMDATTGDQLIPLALSGMREIFGSGRVSPRIHISKYKNFGREGERELSDGLSGRVIQRLGTRVRFPGSAHNTFGFLAQTPDG